MFKSILMKNKKAPFIGISKFLAVIALVVVFVSCSSDDMPSYDIQLAPITSVEFKLDDDVAIDSMTVGLEDKVHILPSYKLEQCQQFEGFTIERNPDDEKEYHVGAVIRVYEAESEQCINEPATGSGEMIFEPQGEGEYLFRFWIGVDSSNENQYLDYTLTVGDGEDHEGDNNEG